MLGLDYIRKNADHVRECAQHKGENPAVVDEVLRVDEAWRAAQTEAESRREQQNRLSKEFGKTRDEALLPSMRELAASVKERMAAADELKGELDRLLLLVPNVYDPSVPLGETEDDNVVIRHWGDKPQFAFEPRPHHELAVALGMLDLERAARVSGARFAFREYANEGAIANDGDHTCLRPNAGVVDIDQRCIGRRWPQHPAVQHLRQFEIMNETWPAENLVR